MHLVTIVEEDGKRTTIDIHSVVVINHRERLVILSSGTTVTLDERAFRKVCGLLGLPEDE
jgi:hypothetical protein